MVALDRVRVFLASPGDAGAERALVGKLIGELNEELRECDVNFELVQWESYPGSVGRPQESINELVHKCDFMVCIFRQDWGSDPGGGIFSSGTEEELFTGLIGLTDPLHPMRNIWVVFLDYQGLSVSHEIVELKDQIIETKALLFEEAKNEKHFAEKFKRALRSWSSVRGDKEVKHVSLKPRSGKDVVGASYQRIRGLTLAKFGVSKEAETAFLEAVELGGVPEKLAYAQFLGRESRLPEAKEIVQSAIDALARDPNTLPAQIAEAYISKASLERRSGNTHDARATLRLALPQLTSMDMRVVQLRARIKDELGVSLYHQGLKVGNDGDRSRSRKTLDDSMEYLKRAMEERKAINDLVGIAQSEINLGRLLVAQEDFDEAISLLGNAIDFLESHGGEILANAYLARAQALLAKYSGAQDSDTRTSGKNRDLDSAVDDAENSLATNRQLGNQRGQAMCLNIMAQLYARKGEPKRSQELAKQCLEINVALGTNAPDIVSQMAGLERSE